MKPNLLLDFEQVLLPLRGCDTGETLLHADHQTPILQICRTDQPPARLMLHGLWQMTQNGLSLCTYIGGKNRDGAMLKHLRRIEGRRLQRLRFLPEKQHLFLDFDDGLRLRLFASPMRPEAYRLILPRLLTSAGSRREGFFMTCYGVHQGGLARATWWE